MTDREIIEIAEKVIGSIPVDGDVPFYYIPISRTEDIFNITNCLVRFKRVKYREVSTTGQRTEWFKWEFDQIQR